MATISAPRGFQPVGNAFNSYTTGGFRKYKIASNETYAIGNGDPVVMLTTGSARGTIQRFNTTVAATTITSSGTFLGVFAGCEYTDPATGQKVFNQYYPGAIVASDIYANVYDDPDQIFSLQADGAVAQTSLGCNFAIIQTAVTNTVTKNSGLQLDASSNAATTTLPVRVVDFDVKPGFNTIGDAYTDVLVRFNNHFHRQLTGVAAS